MYRKVNSHFLERFVCFCRRGNRGLTKNWITIQGSTSPIILNLEVAIVQDYVRCREENDTFELLLRNFSQSRTHIRQIDVQTAFRKLIKAI